MDRTRRPTASVRHPTNSVRHPTNYVSLPIALASLPTGFLRETVLFWDKAVSHSMTRAGGRRSFPVAERSDGMTVAVGFNPRFMAGNGRVAERRLNEAPPSSVADATRGRYRASVPWVENPRLPSRDEGVDFEVGRGSRRAVIKKNAVRHPESLGSAGASPYRTGLHAINIETPERGGASRAVGRNIFPLLEKMFPGSSAVAGGVAWLDHASDKDLG